METFKATLPEIKNRLEKKGFSAKLIPETQQVYTLFKIEGYDYPIFIRIYEAGELLQFMVFFPIDVKAEQVSDVARLLHMLNKELDIPGFGIDETEMVTYFRCMLNTPKQMVDANLFERYLDTLKNASESFGQTIAAIAVGVMKFDDLLKQAKQRMQAMSQVSR